MTQHLILDRTMLPGERLVVTAVFYDPDLFVRSLLRASEFTESNAFAGKNFALQEHLTWFHEQNDRHYGDIVSGINISSESLTTFYSFYKDSLTVEETAFREKLPDGVFYLVAINVGACRDDEDIGDVLRHEFSHALYFYDAEYRNIIESVWNKSSAFDRVRATAFLAGRDYHSHVMLDEYGAHAIEWRLPMKRMKIHDLIDRYYNENINQDEITRLIALVTGANNETVQREPHSGDVCIRTITD